VRFASELGRTAIDRLPRRSGTQGGEFRLQFTDPLLQCLGLLHQRLRNGQVVPAMSAENGLVPDLLGTKRTQHHRPDAISRL
jgi:hypothetical protein